MAKQEKSPTLREMGAVFEGSGFPEGDAVVQDIITRCYASEALLVVANLIERVESMKMASHFRSDQPLNEIYLTKTRNPLLSSNLPESEHKRQCLLIHLRKIHHQMLLLFGHLGDVVLDIEASSREFFDVQSSNAGTTPENPLSARDRL